MILILKQITLAYSYGFLRVFFLSSRRPPLCILSLLCVLPSPGVPLLLLWLELVHDVYDGWHVDGLLVLEEGALLLLWLELVHDVYDGWLVDGLLVLEEGAVHDHLVGQHRVANTCTHHHNDNILVHLSDMYFYYGTRDFVYCIIFFFTSRSHWILRFVGKLCKGHVFCRVWYIFCATFNTVIDDVLIKWQCGKDLGNFPYQRSHHLRTVAWTELSMHRALRNSLNFSFFKIGLKYEQHWRWKYRDTVHCIHNK